MKQCKDYNDLLVQDYSIGSLETEPLDIACLNVLLEEYPKQEDQYKKASRFCKSVHDSMVLADIATLLAKRWGRSIDDVKKYLDVSATNEEELWGKTHGFSDSFDDLKSFIGQDGVPLGFPSLDFALDGVKRREIVLLGAYTNQGKSFVAAKVAAHRLMDSKDNLLIFSMEMPRGQFLANIVEEILGVDEDTLVEMLKTEQGLQVYSKVSMILDKRVRFVDEPNKTIDDLEKITEACYANDFPVDFVIFDHFHLIPQIDDIPVLSKNANQMKEYVKKFNLILFMLCQFNEESQSNYSTDKKKKPYEAMLRHIKGANALKAIADIVLLLWRPYKTDTQLDFDERDKIKNVSCIKIGKSRRKLRGPADIFQYKVNDKTTRMEEINYFG